MERKVGEIFFDGNVTLQAIKAEYAHTCIGCYYNIHGVCQRNRDAAGACTDALRADHQFVIFKEIQL